MPTPRRLAARTASVAAVLGLSITLATASPAAAAKDWGMLDSLDRGKLQACKVSADGGDAWKIKLRITNRNDYRVSGKVRAFDGETATDNRWASGWVRRGETSTVGSVTTGREDTWRLEFSLSADQSGGGGTRTVADIGRC